MILSAQDKSNANLNRSLMGSFWSLVDDLELKELKLKGRKFNWSNDVTQTRIDRTFYTTKWDLMLPNCALQVVSASVFDHYPLVLVGNTTRWKYKGLIFESFWPKMSRYQDIVKEAWARPLQIHNPYLWLHTKLERARKSLKQWARLKIVRNKLLLCVAKQLVGILNVVQDFRQLSVSELQLKRDLKARILGMTAIEKIRAKQ